MAGYVNKAMLEKARMKFRSDKDKILARAGTILQQETQRLLSGSSPSPPGSPPGNYEDHLRASIAYEVNTTSSFVRVGTNIKYGRIQELGGTIKPKQGSFLVFPLRVGSSITRTGRRSTRKARVVTRFGELQEVTTSGLKHGHVYKWVKVRQVTLPPRPYLRPALDNTWPRIQALFQKHFGKGP